MDFYGASPPPSSASSSLSCDLDASLLSDLAQKKLLEAQRAVAAMEKVEGNWDANWIGNANTGGGRFPCKNRQGLFHVSLKSCDLPSDLVGGMIMNCILEAEVALSVGPLVSLAL